MKNVIKIYRELFRRYPSMKWQIPVRAVLTVLSPLIEGAIPAMAIAMILEKDIIRYVAGISVLLLIDAMARIIGNILKNKFSLCTSECRMSGFWAELIRKGITMDYCNLEPAAMQDKMQRGENALNGNTLGIEGLWNSTFDLVCYSFGLLSYGGIIFTIDVRILLVMVVMSVISFLLHRHAVKYSDKKTKENIQPDREFGLITWEARVPDYGKDIRIYHVENWFGQLFAKHITRIRRWFSNTELRWYFPTISDSAFGIVRDILMYSILIFRVLRGTVTVAEFTFYISIVAGFASWLSNFLFKVSAVMKTNVETKGYFEFMDIEDVFLHGEGERFDDTSPVDIEFRDVSFHYDNEEEIFSHLSFQIEKGKKIALVGNNGAGKTTLVKLLCGFYLPTEGEILINGVPTGKYDIDDYRRGVSSVFQDGFISAVTIAENVAGGEGEIDRERVRECLRWAGLWEKVASLPDREDSYITQQLEKSGVEFSGGESQKLLIARALYQNGRLLILDEPTSALDPIAESNIYEKYNEMTDGRTSLFISHRLASTKFCDEILFMENGRVVERGTHEELLEKGGKYAQMFEIQSHYYKEEVKR